ARALRRGRELERQPARDRVLESHRLAGSAREVLGECDEDAFPQQPIDRPAATCSVPLSEPASAAARCLWPERESGRTTRDTDVHARYSPVSPSTPDVVAWSRAAVAYSSSKGSGDTWKLLSRLAIARRRPSGLNVAWVTSSRCTVIVSRPGR